MVKKRNDWCYYKLRATSQDPEEDINIKLDKITWIQMVNSALKRSHGVFGEATEYEILHLDNRNVVLKVNYHDREILSTALTTYISNEELIGIPLVINLLQETVSLTKLDIDKDDRLWFKNLIAEEQEAS